MISVLLVALYAFALFIANAYYLQGRASVCEVVFRRHGGADPFHDEVYVVHSPVRRGSPLGMYRVPESSGLATGDTIECVHMYNLNKVHRHGDARNSLGNAFAVHMMRLSASFVAFAACCGCILYIHEKGDADGKCRGSLAMVLVAITLAWVLNHMPFGDSEYAAVVLILPNDNRTDTVAVASARYGYGWALAPAGASKLGDAHVADGIRSFGVVTSYDNSPSYTLTDEFYTVPAMEIDAYFFGITLALIVAQAIDVAFDIDAQMTEERPLVSLKMTRYKEPQIV